MKRIVTFTVIMGLWTSLYGQKIVPPVPTDVLARVGNSVITSRDLIERIELMPWPEKEKPKHYDSSKVKALNSLIAERLLAIEGKHQNVGSDDVARGKVQAMEKLFVRDEMYKREIRQKIRVTEEEVRDGLSKFAWQLHLAAVAVKDRQAGEQLCKLLQKNPSLPAALQLMPFNTVASVETVQVNFGGLDTVFENTAYAIGKKRVSKPFECPTYGWTVAVLIDRGTNPVAEKMSMGDRRYRVDEIIRGRREDPLARRFAESVLGPEKAQVDSVLFEKLAKQLRDCFIRTSAHPGKSGMYMLTAEDYDAVLDALKDDLQKPFISMSERAMTLDEGIEGLRYLHFGFKSLDEKKFKGTLNGQIRFVVETELIAREGYKKNLQYSPNVKHDMDVWSNYLSSRFLKWNVDDSIRVTDTDVLAALDSTGREFGSAYEVNIQEVLCTDADAARRVMGEYATGSPLGQLAQANSIRAAWKSRGGISGYMTLNTLPELTHRAFLADTGVLVGPVKSGDGFSVFKVLSKRLAAKVGYPEVDSVVFNIRQNLTAQKRQKAMNAYVAHLARQYSVDVYYEKLPAVAIQPANMYTRRAIGFGGIITAAPILYPNWEWVKDYRSNAAINP